MTTTTTLLNHDKIRVLNDREKAREKISIWYGSASNYVHGLKEVIANATDEIINHFDEGTVTVTLHDDLQTITVRDTGRGIPIAGETDGIPNYELLFLTLFAGTKYDDDDKTNTGTNGVGLTVLCYTSSLLEVVSIYGGKRYFVRFEDGGRLVDLDLNGQPTDEHHGTIVTFRLDPEIYPVTIYNEEEVKDIVKRYAVSSPKVKLIFKHKDKEVEFHYDSVESYFEEVIGNTSTSPIITLPETLYEDDGEKTSVKIILATTTEPIQESYLNLTYLSEGGAFNEGIVSGVKQFANKYCKENNLFPKGVNSFSTSDIESSISFVCVALSNKVEFQNQTKLSTNKRLYKKVAQKHTMQLLEVFRTENEEGLKKFINHLLLVQKHNTQYQKVKKELKKKLSEKIDGLNRITNLVDCKKHGKDSELFIAEGASALGSIVLARDASYQAVYPLRGKILNCLKADYSTIFKNQVITDLVRVLGCGIQADKKNKDLDTFDINKLRYGKIIIATDADPDGAQIACLIITMFYRLMPALIEKGYIYIAQTPLYEVKLENDEMIYFFSEREKEEKLPKIKGKYTLARCKGLGELNPDTMAFTAMNPETRNLIKVTVDDAKRMAESLEMWMGTIVEQRKEYISENLAEYVGIME
jgi:DNA gyrase subunit B